MVCRTHSKPEKKPSDITPSFAVGPVSFLKDYSSPWSQLLWGQASERLHSVSWLSQDSPSDGTAQLKTAKEEFLLAMRLEE